MGKLTNKSAIITGASSGIGKSIANHLAKEGPM
nr:SDR family NAD(P)-dependent oxidoreductase [Halobacillus shinanisalinarum]